MPFRDSFDCLWCGSPHRVREPTDIEGWAQLCPDCVGRAGENGFLRFRLKTALAERARGARTDARVATLDGDAAKAKAPASTGPTAPAITATPLAGAPEDSLRAEMLAYYEARAPEYDDWYLRRGRYARGAIHDMAWQLDLDTATQWLDAQPIAGEIVELAAGTGWWSPLLAQKGTLSAYDAADAPLDKARDRLLAHNLRAHLHVRDAWAEPDRQVDAVFAGFWLSHIQRGELDLFLGLVRRWLKPGGTFLFIDSREDPQSGAADNDRPQLAPDVQMRRLADGRSFRVVKVYYLPAELEDALARAGFTAAKVTPTSRFFLLGRAVAT
jgi:demethylmenaquinone methyltransferase/2-methoxy-6-polyprenyl-1,4-benzoquinol methylase